LLHRIPATEPFNLLHRWVADDSIPFVGIKGQIEDN